MSDSKDGGPAFPPRWDDKPGMTLRDYIAAQAISSVAAILSTRKKSDGLGPFGEVLANMCYQIADAMIKERSR